jgi:hypothetical protein
MRCYLSLRRDEGLEVNSIKTIGFSWGGELLGSVCRYRLHMPRSFVAALCLLAVAASAQETVTLPADTPVTVATVAPLVPAKLHVGDRVELKLVHAIWVGPRLVAAAGTPVSGRVTRVELKPVAVEVAVDPLTVKETPVVGLAGNPLDSRKGKLVDPTDPMPKELEWHFRLTAGQTAELAGVGLVALPIVAIASPFLLIGALHGDAMNPEKPISPGHRAVLRTTAAATFPAGELEEEKAGFVGAPVIYVVDRLFQKNGRVSCGVDPLLGPKHPSTSMLRVAPRRYTFVADRKEDTQAVVEAKEGERYLVYHDRQGLHAVALMGRPDLVERLPKIEEKTVFLFDAAKVTAEEQAGVERDLARGGCGLAKQLHVRTP